jgi:hypothetical protein
MKRLPPIFLILSISLILLTACQPDAEGKEGEYQIDPQVKAQIDSLNEQIMTGAYQNNPVLIEEIMSPRLLETSGQATDVLVQQISSLANSPSFQVFDEYYLQNQTGKPITQTYSGGMENDAYSIKFESLTDDIYISILRPDEQYGDHLLTLIYGLYENGWKLNIIQFGQYAFLGKTAIDLWNEAKVKETKGYFVDATNLMSLAIQCLKPAKQFWEYREEQNITEYYERLRQQVNAAYRFPIQVEVVESKPVIFGVYPQLTEEGIYPMVEYMSSQSQEDSVALEIENIALHQQIGTIFPGIDKEKSFLLYRAYDSIPDGKRQPVFYGFIREVRE